MRSEVYSTGDWRPVAFKPGKLELSYFSDVAFSADGRLAALMSERDTYQLVTLPACRELVQLKPPNSPFVQQARFSPDGRKLWLVGAHHRVFEWDLTGLRRELALLGLDWED